MKNILSVCLSFCIMCALVGTLCIVSVLPEDETTDSVPQYAVLFAPGTSRAQALLHVVQAGGLPLRGSAFDFIMIAATHNPDFQKNIVQQGAIGVFSSLIKGGCFFDGKTVFGKGRYS